MKQFYKNENEGVFLGVCQGLGEYFGIDPFLFRIAFCLIPGVTLLYFVLGLCASEKPA